MPGDARALFSLPEGLHYLNCASRGPLPKVALAAGVAALERQTAPPSLGPDEHFLASERLRANLAGLVGTSPHRIAIIPAVSYGIGIAVRNCRIRKGQAVVIPEEEFPSDVYGWIAACQRAGGVLRAVPRPAADADVAARWSEAILENIDRSTAVVNLSTVHWTDGLVFDVDAIARRAREVGALCVLDATQSLGALRFDFESTRPDLLLCSTYKWLLGPYQIGFAVVGDRLLEGEPLEHHWSNRAGAEDVTGTAYHHAFRDGARRFDVGEHANDVAVSMLDASVELVRSWGSHAVQGHGRSLLAPLEAYVAESPYRSLRPEEHAGHILGLRAEPALLARALAEAGARDVRVSRRGSALRVSPYLYNTPDDVGTLVEALEAAASVLSHK